jgi:hypothetical protein
MKKVIFGLCMLVSMSAMAEWVNNGSTKDPMDDTIVQGWENLAVGGQEVKLMLTNQTHKEGTDVFVGLRSLNLRWRPFKTKPYVFEGTTYHQGILYGRIRLDNDTPIDIRFSFSDGNGNTFIHFTRDSVNHLIDRELAQKIVKAKRILIQVNSSRFSENTYDWETFEFTGGIKK